MRATLTQLYSWIKNKALCEKIQNNAQATGQKMDNVHFLIEGQQIFAHTNWGQTMFHTQIEVLLVVLIEGEQVFLRRGLDLETVSCDLWTWLVIY